MDSLIFNSILSLGGIGIVAAIVLYFIAQKFKVIEDPRIDDVEASLPGANCGGCGFAGCRNFAEAIVKNESLEGLNCPPGGADTMTEVGKVMGLEAEAQDPTVAVVRCSGSKQNAVRKNNFDGTSSCAVSHSLYSGESVCPSGCMGLGDCVVSCTFDAIYINEETGLPEVIEEKCTSCGACVKACPRSVIEIRKAGKKSRRILVSCINKEKGAVAKKNCTVACIGCQKCVKVCKFDAITVDSFCAYIDFNKCVLCRKCTTECPTNAIVEVNFPPRKPKPPKEDSMKESEVTS